MSYVLATPELMTAAAADLATLGSTLNAAHMTAAAPTIAVLPAAADEVSAGIAHLLSGYGQEYQKLAGEAAAFQAQFVQHLTASAGSYAAAEADNTALLQPLSIIEDSLRSINSAFQASDAGQLFSRVAFQVLNFPNAIANLFLANIPPFLIFQVWDFLDSFVLGPLVLGLLGFLFIALVLERL